jgi:hypothetical protein
MGIISATVIGDPDADDDADDDDADDDDGDDDDADDDDDELPVASPDALEQALSPMAATAATASIGRYLFMAFLRCSVWVQRRERGPGYVGDRGRPDPGGEPRRGGCLSRSRC